MRASASPSRTARTIARSAATRDASTSRAGEVQETEPAISAEQVVTGVRVSERDPVAIQQPEVEPEDDLAVAVAPRLVDPAHGLEALALDVLDTSTRRVEMLVSTRGTRTKGCPRSSRSMRRWFWASSSCRAPLRSVRASPRPAPRVQPRGEPLNQREQQRRVAQVRVDRLGDPGTGSSRPPRRRRRSWRDAPGRSRPQRTHAGRSRGTRAAAARRTPAASASRSANRTGGTCRGARRGSAAVRPAAPPGARRTDHREHLADLHRRAAQLPKLFDKLLDQRRVRSLSAAAARSGVRTRLAVRIPAHRRP